MGRFTFLLTITIGIALAGCSGHSSQPNPVAPGLQIPLENHSIQTANSRVLWGLCDVTFTPTGTNTAAVELVPLRGATFNANVQKFLTPPISPINLITFEFQPDSNFTAGYVKVKVGIGHPFPGLPQYRGFDVRAIFMADSDTPGAYDPLVSFAKPDPYGNPTTVPYMINPDGYTRWWNAVEFTDPMPLFSFKPSILGTDTSPTAILNPYKYYTDGLCCDEPVAGIDMLNRGSFTPSGTVNGRVFEIQFPTDPLQFRFNLAVDASYEQPDPSGAPDYPVESYSLSANVHEPFLVEGRQTGGNLFYADGYWGGKIEAEIDVYDWQAMADGGSIAGEINNIYLEGEPLGTPIDVIPIAHSVPGPAPGVSSTYTFELDADYFVPDDSGEFVILGTVESSEPTGYMPQIEGGENFIYPEANLAAYFTMEFTVSNVLPELTVTTPNGGEIWAVGSSQTVKWTVSDAIETVKIEYSKDDFNTDVNVIVNTTPNSGTYLWDSVPDDISDSVRVRVTSFDFPTISDASDEYFSIVDNIPEAIVFRGDGPGAGMQIYSIDPEGIGPAEQWTDGVEYAFRECAKLSPCGQYIMYTFCDLSVGNIRLIDVATGIETDITPEGKQALYSDFSHDGTKIVAAMADQWYGPHDLWTFDYNGENTEQLTTGADVWAPEYNFDDSEIYYMEFAVSEVRIYNVTTGTITHYTDNGAWNDDPTGNGDGTQIAWATSYGMSGGRHIWISPITSWNPPDVEIDFENYIRSPGYSPDYTKLVFDHGAYDGSELCIYDLSDDTYHDITDNEWGEYMADWGVMIPH